MRLLAVLLGFAGLCAAIVPASVSAQNAPPALKLKSGKQYTHPHTKISVPLNLGGMKRTGGQAYFENNLDIGLQFDAVNSDEAISVYIFRNTSGNVPIWFDRAREHIEKRDKFGKATASNPPVSFALTPKTSNSAMRITYSLSGTRYKSSGLALIPVSEFYVKVRVSSLTRTSDELDAWMTQIINEIQWPNQTVKQPEAIAIKPCTTSLTFEGGAKIVEQDLAAKLFSGILGIDSITSADDPKEAGTTETWCRDGYEMFPSGVYRPENGANKYLLALSDSGRSVHVGPDVSAILTEELKEKESAKSGTDNAADNKAITYGIKFSLPDSALTYNPRDRLVDPGQAFEIVQSEAPNVTKKTWGKQKGNININSGSIK